MGSKGQIPKLFRTIVRKLFRTIFVCGLLMAMLGAPRAWADAPPSSSVVTVAYGSEQHQLLDLRLPDADAFAGPRPVVVYLHAGGWVGGDRTDVIDEALAQVVRGYAVASVDYELATVDADGTTNPSFSGAIWDVKRAIRFLKANAATWNLDPNRVVLMGASAGGHLAAFVAATRGEFEPPELRPTASARQDSSVRGIVDLVGPSDLVTFARTDHPWAAPLAAAFLGCPMPTATEPLTCDDERLAAASVTTHVDVTDPPIYLAYGAEDTLVVPATQGMPLARIWLDAHHGNPASVAYQLVETAGHNLPYEDVLNPITPFLDRVTSSASYQSLQRDPAHEIRSTRHAPS